MNEIKHIHRQAMEQSDLAAIARMKGNEQDAQEHALRAFELEAQAANALLNNYDAEPTRSVLFRSAATLARDCGRLADSEKLIHRALAGEPPAEILTELQDLLEQVSFSRHLELRGIKLSGEEIQLAITGNSVGLGMASTDALLGRVHTTETLLFRTGERKQLRPYRDKGRKDARLEKELELYMSVPRAACFAVTFRVGASLQQSFPGLSLAENVIDEVLDCLQLFAKGEDEQLKERIKDDAYYRNFVGLARTLQPDGAKVNMVGFTAMRYGATKQVALLTPTSEAPVLKPKDVLPEAAKNTDDDDDFVKLRGTLKMATSLTKQDEIRILTSENVKERIVVPSGMMTDIVKPLWESEVEVTGTRKGKKIHLIQIKEVS